MCWLLHLVSLADFLDFVFPIFHLVVFWPPFAMGEPGRKEVGSWPPACDHIFILQEPLLVLNAVTRKRKQKVHISKFHREEMGLKRVPVLPHPKTMSDLMQGYVFTRTRHMSAVRVLP